VDATFFQIAIVVESMEEARRQLCERMGTTFTEPITIDMLVEIDGQIHERQIQVCFSKHQLPHLELIYATGTPWYDGRTGLHHLAVWAEDAESDVKALVEAGGHVVARRVDENGRPCGFYYVKQRGGPIIEILNASRQPELRALMGDGVLS
jgi:hypothetical protein